MEVVLLQRHTNHGVMCDAEINVLHIFNSQEFFYSILSGTRIFCVDDEKVSPKKRGMHIKGDGI